MQSEFISTELNYRKSLVQENFEISYSSYEVEFQFGDTAYKF